MIKKKLLFCLLVIFLLLIENTLLKPLRVGGFGPQLLLLLVLWVGWKKGWKKGAEYGFFIGFFQDLIFSPLWGVGAFSFFLAGWLAGEASSRFYTENIFAWILVILLGSVATSFTQSLWLKVFGIVRLFEEIPEIFYILLPYNLLFGTIFFFLHRKLKLKAWKFTSS